MISAGKISQVECSTLYGKKRLIPADKLVFRPGVYALIIKDGKIVIVRNRSTGKYFFPGGGVNIGEKIEDALKREVSEETGLKIVIERFFHFKESFFYYDPWNEAYHSFSFFFICRPATLTFANKKDIQDEEAENPEWIEIKNLKAENIQSFGEIIELLKTNHK